MYTLVSLYFTVSHITHVNHNLFCTGSFVSVWNEHGKYFVSGGRDNIDTQLVKDAVVELKFLTRQEADVQGRSSLIDRLTQDHEKRGIVIHYDDMEQVQRKVFSVLMIHTLTHLHSCRDLRTRMCVAYRSWISVNLSQVRVSADLMIGTTSCVMNCSGL